MDNDVVCLKIQTPSVTQIVGFSSSGKSFLTARMVRERKRLFVDDFDEIVWVFAEYQPLFDELKRDVEGIVFTDDMEVANKYVQSKNKSLLILDDMLSQLMSNAKSFLPYFLQTSHHCHTTIIYLTQALFAPNTRLMNINSHYLITFKLPRDSSSILRLGFQIYPMKPRFVYLAYEHAVNRKPYGHFVIDSRVTQSEKARFRSSIFYWEEDMILYVPKHEK